jgi:membrane associated rhomboid family serine protease
MGLGGRRYMRGWEEGGHGQGVALGLPRPTPVVGWLLAINFAVFLLQLFLDRPAPGWQAGRMSGLFGATIAGFWQVWRYLTFQFLHGDAWHVILNMLGVYFFGPALEGHWGGRRFLAFYLACGAVAGLAYVLIGWLAALNPFVPIIGASGGVYAILLACAVFFPHFQIILLFFPVPIRLAAVLLFGGMVLFVGQGLAWGQPGAAASDVAHLGGAVAAAAWLLGPAVLRRLPALGRLGGKGRWQRQLARRRRLQERIDRLLGKINRQGLNSLSWWEKRQLRRASRRQRLQEQSGPDRRGW